MPEVRGFSAIRYNPEKIDDFDKVITPPFDVINPQQREELHGRSPYNMARILLPDERDGKTKYEAAAEDLDAWIAEDVFKQDDADSLYLLEQTFKGLDGNEYTRRGFFGVAKLPEEGERTILGHERTFEYKVKDRLALTKACEANTGAVFVMYEDPDRDIDFLYAPMDECEPDMTATTIEGTHVRLWRVGHDDRIPAFFEQRSLYIADGHHRFLTACVNKRDTRAANGDQPGRHDYIMMGFVPLHDPGLIVYPAHRALDIPENFDEGQFFEKVEEWFDIKKTEGALVDAVNAESNTAFGLTIGGEGDCVLVLKDGVDRAEFLGEEHGPAWREVDVSVLHGGLFERIMGLDVNTEFVYEPDPAKVVDLVSSGEKGMALLLQNMNPAQICRCADADEYMPQKATYFFPKLPSGAVIHRLK